MTHLTYVIILPSEIFHASWINSNFLTPKISAKFQWGHHQQGPK